MKVRKNYLLLIAAFGGAVAGGNILRIGVEAYGAYVGVLNVLLSAAVYLVFQVFVFGKMVRKHTVRIVGYEEEMQFFLKFFDKKAFCIMAFMMTFGIGLRVSGWCPEVFIDVFYTGLGASLLTAGVLFLVNFTGVMRKSVREA